MYFLGGANTHAVDTKLVECAFDNRWNICY